MLCIDEKPQIQRAQPMLKRAHLYLHFAPAPWLNPVECWFALLAQRGLFTSVQESA